MYTATLQKAHLWQHKEIPVAEPRYYRKVVPIGGVREIEFDDAGAIRATNKGGKILVELNIHEVRQVCWRMFREKPKVTFYGEQNPLHHQILFVLDTGVINLTMTEPFWARHGFSEPKAVLEALLNRCYGLGLPVRQLGSVRGQV